MGKREDGGWGDRDFLTENQSNYRNLEISFQGSEVVICIPTHGYALVSLYSNLFCVFSQQVSL